MKERPNCHNDTRWAMWCVISVCGLLLIWALPGTIALRHFLIITGFASSVFVIGRNLSLFSPDRARLIPLFSLFSLFVWVGIHYFFFSLNRNLQLNEIAGLWIRAFAGCVTAIGLGISLQKYPALRKYFFIAVFFTPIVNLGSYLYACYLHAGCLKPNEFVRFFFIKIETAYFGAIAAAVAVANLIVLFTGRSQKLTILSVSTWMVGLVLVLLSAFVSSTKNGMAIAVALCILLVTVIIANALVNLGKSTSTNFLAALIILSIVGLIWKGHQIFAAPGWNTVLEDARIAANIDENKQWQQADGAVSLPTNSSGKPVAGNTYARVAWAMVGVRLIGQYPFGYGSINESFVGLMDEEKIRHGHMGQTHSGWIDFGLAFGVPGLILVFTSLLLTIAFGLSARSPLNLLAVMICVTLIPFSAIAEMSWKQYFESMLFFISLAATLIAAKGEMAGGSLTCK